jgi:uncharacterized protein
MAETLLFIYLFVLFSLLGWILEVIYRSVKQGRPVNPGFLTGPYLPLYGFSVVALTFCIIYVNSRFLETLFIDLVFRINPLHDLKGLLTVAFCVTIILKVILYSFVTTGIEFLTGRFFGHLLKRPLWDYSHETFCIGGSVCLKYSSLWIMFAFIYEYLIFPAALSLGLSLNPQFVLGLSMAVCLTIILDFCTQTRKMVMEQRATSIAKNNVNRSEFIEIVKPLLEKEEVKRLADFKHHGQKTRLDHSLDVAWLSYMVTKEFSWDYTSATRGALLHDLFHYDWVTEGPRLHGFRHPRICLENAEKVTDLNECERNSIKRHMWPLTIIPPRYPESWSVCLADTYCGVRDYAEVLKHFKKVVTRESPGRF